MTPYVYIEGIGEVQADFLVERYPDGDVRVRYNGRDYICKEVGRGN